MSYPGVRSQGVRPPKLEGTPYKYHVYIASCSADEACRKEIALRLERVDFFVYHEEDHTKAEIEKGVDFSRKMILLLTENFLNDDFHSLQVNLAKEKADSVSPDDIIIIKSNDISCKNAGLQDSYRSLSLSELQNHSSELTYSMLYSLLTDESKQSLDVRANMGAAMAYSYFYGYLRIILPGICERIAESGFMVGVGKDKLNERNMPKKFIIIVPESLRGPSTLNAIDERITDLGIIKYKGGRGGNVERDYSTFVHKIQDPGNEPCGIQSPKEYLFVGEVPNILINLYDMEKSGIRISRRRRNLEVRQFYYYLQHLLKHDPNCKEQVCFVYHSDEEMRNYQQVGDIILQKIKDEIWTDIILEARYHAPKETSSASKFETVGDVKNTSLKVKYLKRPLKYYPLDKSQKTGPAIIINNRNFAADTGLKTRTGSEHDEEKVVELLEWLNYDVTCFQDCTAQQMQALASRYSSESVCEDAQALICVIMTHGEAGKLLGVDGKSVTVVEMADVFGKCRALKGKPKMFFIEACQSDHVQHDALEKSSNQAKDVKGESEDEHKEDQASCSAAVKGTQPVGNEEERERLTPAAADFLVSYSTLPGKRAYRDPTSGTLYVQNLCRLIRTYCKAEHLEKILKQVASAVREEIEKRSPELSASIVPEQLPFFISSMEKHVALIQ